VILPDPIFRAATHNIHHLQSLLEQE